MYCMAFFLIILTIVLSLAIMFGQIIPPIIDSFALPFSFFFSMFGVNVNGELFELDNVNNDERDKANLVSVFTNFWDIRYVWNRGNVLKIIQRFI